MLVLALFHAVAIVANVWFWSQPVLSLVTLLVAALCAISIVAATVTDRRVQQVATIAYCLVALFGTFVESPTSY